MQMHLPLRHLTILVMTIQAVRAHDLQVCALTYACKIRRLFINIW